MPIAPMLAACATGHFACSNSFDRQDRQDGRKRGRRGGAQGRLLTRERRGLRRVTKAAYFADLLDEDTTTDLDSAFRFASSPQTDEEAAWENLLAELDRWEDERAEHTAGWVEVEAQVVAYEAQSFEPCPEADEASCSTCGEAFDACWMCRCDMPIDDEVADEGRIDEATVTEAEQVAYEACGWGTVFEPEDLGWGFTVTARPLGATGTVGRDPRTGRFTSVG